MSNDAADESAGLTEDAFYEELDLLHDQRAKGLYVSSARAARELARRVKSAGMLIPYLQTRFVTANGGGNTLDPQAAYDAAVELIALIEDPSRRRQIQPDHDEAAAEAWCDTWRVPCYHLLASNQGRMRGDNSPGLHACIADGLEVARRTGSPFISSFHEFATDVHLAADDLELAEHHAVANMTRPLGTNREDRRWVGSKDYATITLLRGDVDVAFEAARQAVELSATWHARPEAYFESVRHAQAVAILGGLCEPTAEAADAFVAPFAPEKAESVYHPAAGEDLDYDLHQVQHQSLLAAARGEFDAAIEPLVRWDTQLKPRALANWFDLRLRLVALLKLAGRDTKAAALATELETRAAAANDYLTLRRLRSMLRGRVPVSPYPTVAPLTKGPWGGTSQLSDESVETAPTTDPTADAAPNAPAAARPPAEWQALMEDLWRQTQEAHRAAAERAARQAAEAEAAQAEAAQPRADAEQAKSDPGKADVAPAESSDVAENAATPAKPEPVYAELASVVAAIREIPPTSITADQADDLMQVLFIAAERGRPLADIWTATARLLAAHPKAAHLIAFAASIGDLLLRAEVSLVDPPLSRQDVTRMVAEAQTMSPEDARVFRRAGQVALAAEDFVEAERCLARASRLHRGNCWAAEHLARLYSSSDRPSAALTVLDLCIRECPDDELNPGILWQAATLAQQLDQHQAAVTYFDRYAKFAPEEPGLAYHRAISLSELGRIDEAEQGADREWALGAADRAEGTPQPMPMAALRAVIAAARRDAEAVQHWVRIALAEPLSEMGWLTPGTMQKCLLRLWRSTSILTPDDPVRMDVQRRLTLSGLAPDEVWDTLRKMNPVASVRHFIVQAVQGVAGEWAGSPFRLPGQEDWNAYRVRYGVLATDEDQAVAFVRAMQLSGHEQPPEIQLVEPEPGEYNDHPGITLRSWPESADPDDGENAGD
jgi:tetratricopeptide (TPR) repeat protein